MEFWYGTVRLTAVDLQSYRRQNVYTPDGADLLYVKHILAFTAAYMPGGAPVMPSATQISADTTGRLDGSDDTKQILLAGPRGRDPGAGRAIIDPPALETEPGPVAQAQWRSGPETDAELNQRLMLPRQKMILWAFDRQTGTKIRWLESPRPGFCVDAANGPIPISSDVVSASGEPNSIGVLYQISTCQTPCPIGSDRLVLSHRWEMTHEPNQDGYLTRVIIGEITFHSGVVSVLSARPDLIAAQLIHPIPLGFERSPPVLTQSSDGLTIRYTLRDSDPTIVFAAGDSGASRIEIVERHESNVPAGVDLLNRLRDYLPSPREAWQRMLDAPGHLVDSVYKR